MLIFVWFKVVPAVTFLVLNIPRIILNLLELNIYIISQGLSNFYMSWCLIPLKSIVEKEDNLSCECDLTPTWYLVTISVSHLALTINRYSLQFVFSVNLWVSEASIDFEQR